jgi:Uma2 family endonuclease
MRFMSLPTVEEIVDAGEHLPSGATLIIDQITWDDYERLVEELDHRTGLRISYDCGRLEIVSPLRPHARYERFIDKLVALFCDVFQLKCESLGDATWSRKTLLKGLQADGCFYIQHAEQVIGRDDFDLESAPPPDLAVEIDITRKSLRKLAIYAALRVPEVWRYDGIICRFYRLSEGRYSEIQVSDSLAGLTPQMIADAVESSKTVGQDEAIKAFRSKIQDLRQP